jgi:hypothetical protein
MYAPGRSATMHDNWRNRAIPAMQRYTIARIRTGRAEGPALKNRAGQFFGQGRLARRMDAVISPPPHGARMTSGGISAPFPRRFDPIPS